MYTIFYQLSSNKRTDSQNYFKFYVRPDDLNVVLYIRTKILERLFFSNLYKYEQKSSYFITL